MISMTTNCAENEEKYNHLHLISCGTYQLLRLLLLTACLWSEKELSLHVFSVNAQQKERILPHPTRNNANVIKIYYQNMN